ncbi:MAG: hypothetical protein KDC80_23000 [Saprospiraceae bacterium]|nr:hypothetical protein [Saprospiraceae bacterium]
MFTFSTRMVRSTIIVLICFLSIQLVHTQPIRKDLLNPHYLNYKGAPVLLITSAEHYGSVINLDFDYNTYLQTMHDEGMNYTRIFTGSYVEVPGSFGITNNTLSPAVGKFLAPWQRVDEPGLFEAEGKFDLNQWNDQYFLRLHDFIRKAQSLDIIVEVTFFCATYQDGNWLRHPFNPDNNINELGTLDRKEFNSLENDKAVHFQKELLIKLVKELNRYDNIFFELCNEPWADNGDNVAFLHKTLIPRENSLGWLLWATAATGRTLEWQDELTETFRETESNLEKKHLLAQNYSNFKSSLATVHDGIDILNFHYAWPESVTQNYGWDRPVNFDESGFAGTHDTTYLQEAWAFILSGGAIFNGLDYSFYPGKEDGTGTNEAPGGGSTNFRRQLKFLNEFMSTFEFIKMRPADPLMIHSPGMESFCLADPGQSYAIYVQGRNQGVIHLKLPDGHYTVNIFNPDTGRMLKQTNISGGEDITLEIPANNRLAIGMKRR